MKRNVKGSFAKKVSLLLAIILVITQMSLVTFADDNNGVTHDDLGSNDTVAPVPWGALPSSNQLTYQQDELAAFCHFGMNTFTNVEWGNGSEKPSQFNLQKDFDAELFVKTIFDAGFKKLIITAKHHDGFCIWPSEYTGHDVASSPYKDGDGDILAELSAACTKYNIDMGLYLSPWDANAESYGYYDANGKATSKENDVQDYNEYYANQIEEIAGNPKYGNNGRFVEWWMDGAKGGGADAQEYDFVKWFETIQKYEGKAAGFEDDCLLFGAESYSTVRWIGNESGFAHDETWSKSKSDRANNTMNSNSSGGFSKGFFDGNQWTVPESDARITPGWFWHPNQSPKTMEQLSEMYFRSVGHNSPLLLNIPPNNQGSIDTAIVERTLEFGQAIKALYAVNFATKTGASISASAVRGNDTAYSPNNLLDGNPDTYWTLDDGQTTGSVTIDLGERTLFDVVSIQEHLALGQRISGYSVEYKDGDGPWKLVEAGPTIGGRRLVRTSPLRGTQVRINITGSHDVPILSEIGIHKASGGFEIGSPIPEDLNFIDDRGFTTTGSWSQGSTGMNNTNMWASTTASTAKFTFTGSSFILVANTDPSHGILEVVVDGQSLGMVDTYANPRQVSKLVYTSPDLEHGDHTVELKVTGTKNASSSNVHIDLDGAFYLNNGGAGMFDLEFSEYDVVAGETLTAKIVRTTGSTGEVSIQVMDNPGSAVQGQYYENIFKTITFGDGETEKTVTLDTYVNSEQISDLDFSLELANPTNGGALGFNSYVKVNLRHFKLALSKILAEAVLKEQHQYHEAQWNPFELARDNAQAVFDDASATYEETRQATVDLVDAMNALVEFAGYTDENPFAFPTNNEASKPLEGEHFILKPRVPGEEPNNTNKNVRLSADSGASNGFEVNWFENGNKIELPYTAQAGTYEVTATYRSGRASTAPNVFAWSGENIVAGSQDVFGPEASTHRTVTFELEITQSGAGTLVFDATAKAGPVIDKFDIVKKVDKSLLQTAVTSGNALVAASEDDYTPTSITALKNALTAAQLVLDNSTATQAEVDGALGVINTAVGGLLAVDFIGYTEGNPFVFPSENDSAKPLEAEHFILKLRVPGEEPNNTNKNVRLDANTDASNGLEVNWFEDGNKIELPYTAEAGIYEVTARYRSGRSSAAPNVFSWSGDNVVAGFRDVFGPEPDTYRTVTFEVEITESGAGTLVFDSTAKAGPVTDKFDIVKKIVIPPVDKSLLEAAVASGNTLIATSEDDYTPATITALRTALASAQLVLDNVVATQLEVDGALAAVNAAVEGLVTVDPTPTVDKSLLQTAVTSGNTLVATSEDDYTPATITALRTALASAQLILDNVVATQLEVNGALAAVNTAVEGLIAVDPTPTVDKSLLQTAVTSGNTLVATSEDDYTPATITALRAALASAQLILDNVVATQLEVNGALATVNAAVGGLVTVDPTPTVDKTPLQTAVTSGNTLVATSEDDYTPATITALRTALASAQTVLDNVVATQLEVNGALATVNAAVGGLVTVDPDPDPKPDPDPDPDPKPDPDPDPDPDPEPEPDPKPEPPPTVIVSKGRSSSGSAGTSTPDTSPNITPPTAKKSEPTVKVSGEKAAAALTKAVKENKGGEGVVVSFADTGGITKEAAKALVKQGKAAGIEDLKLNFTQTENGKVIGSVTVSAKDISEDFVTTISLNNSNVKKVDALFKRSFGNALGAVQVGERKTLDEPITVTLKADLTGLDVNNLVLYTYDHKTNKYSVIKDLKYSVGDNGDLTFSTNTTGFIVISTGKLSKAN